MSDEKVAGTTPVPQEGVSPEAAAKAEAAVLASAIRKKAKDRTPDETRAYRKYNSQKQKVSRAKKGARKNVASHDFDSPMEPKAAEAKEILAARGLKNPHVIDRCYELGLHAAREKGVTPNRFLFQNGIARTLASYAQKAPQLLEPVPAEPVVGELSNRAELVCLHDFSIAWREDAVDLPEFLRLRRLCKTDAFELGKLQDKDFEECCQGEWTIFLPRFNPDTLKPNYTQKDMRLWLDSISPVKDYLLMASRNSMKSSFVLVWLLTLHLCAPDARAVLVSETQKLSSGFIRAYRNYWEVQPQSETMLQKLFPEFCIKPGEGSELYFRSPMAHLNLIQPSASRTSAETSETGGRADVIIYDDIISNLTVGNEEQIQKSINIYDLLQKIREVLGSFSLVIGTPWAPMDLYATLLKRAEESDAPDSMASRIDPIVTVKPDAFHKLTTALLPTLTEEDVESYLLPVRMPWRFVRKEITANPAFALSQNFCIFPKGVDEGLRVQFDPDELRLRWRPLSFFGEAPAAQVVLGLDRAFSTSRYADYSCATIAKIQMVEGKTAMVVHDVRMDRYKESDLVRIIVDLIERYRPTIFIAEKDRSWENLANAIRQQCLMRGIVCPYMRWKDILPNDRAKAKRVKGLELPISDGRFWFTQGRVTEDHLHQFEIFDGIHDSNSSRKDDFCDTCAILWENLGPRYQDEVKAEDQEQREQQLEEEAARARRQEMHQKMFPSFGGTIKNPQPSSQDGQMKLSQWYKTRNNPGATPPAPEPEPQAPADPRLRLFGKRGPWRM